MKNTQKQKFQIETDPVIHISSLASLIVVFYSIVSFSLFTPMVLLTLVAMNFVWVNLFTNFLRLINMYPEIKKNK